MNLVVRGNGYRASLLALVVIGAVLAGSCGGSSISPSDPNPPVPPPVTTGILSGAGDIALCGTEGAAQTAALLDGIGGYIFTAGDNAYFHGSATEYANCYEPTWGRFKSRTFATPGNHDYESAGAAPYFEYFGDRAGPSGLGYYTYKVGSWTVVSLNSNIEASSFTSQQQWLRDTLTATRPHCLAAIWHHPLVSSGPNGPSTRMRDAWRILQEFNAEFVITAHDHLYERFAPLNFDGVPSATGIREFVVGTGGAERYQVVRAMPGSEATYMGHGVISFRLESESYSWQYMSTPNGVVRDSGTGVCK